MAKKRPKKNIGNQGDVGRRAAQIAQDRDAANAALAEYESTVDRSQLHPSLRHLADDDDVPIIITTGSQKNVAPNGAAELIGELKKDIYTESGDVLPEGSYVWRDTREGSLEERAAASRNRIRPGSLTDRDTLIVPSTAGVQFVPDPLQVPARLPEDSPITPLTPGYEPPGGALPRLAEVPAGTRRRAMQAEVPAAFRRTPAAAFSQALEGQQPGLTEKLGRGLSPEELADPGNLQAIARAAAGAGPGQYSVVQDAAQGTARARVITGGSRTDSEPGIPGGLQPGDIIAAAQPLGYEPAGIDVPEGAGEPGDQVFRPIARPGGPELIVTDDLNAIDTTDADLVIEDLDPGDPDDSGRVLTGSPAAVRRWHERMADADRRGAKLIPGTTDKSALARTREAAEAIGLRENWSASDVLLAHEWLAKHYRDPSDEIADYLAFHIRNALAQDHKTADMFWPLDLVNGADIPEGVKMARLIARGLGAARTFQVTSQMCRAMRDAPGQLTVLDEGLLPVPAGFAWLDAPWLTETDAGYWLPVRAVSWERTVVLLKSHRGAFGAPPEGAPSDAVRIVLWLRFPDDVAFGRWRGQEQRALKAANQVGNLAPMQIVMLPFGVRVNTGERFRTNGRELMSLMHTLWRTLGETLPRSRPVQAQLPGGPRQAARRTLKHTDVHVVTLREYRYDSDPVPHHPQPGNWTCRWWVNAFYRHIDRYEDGTDEKGRNRRHQAVPAQQPGLLPDDDHDVCAVCLANNQTVRISYVAGFDKGPPGLPYRTPSRERTVYRLAR